MKSRTSQHVLTPISQEWVELVKLYKRDNMYLAESGQQLTRLVNYEIPTIKHQLSRSQQIIRVGVYIH